MLLLAITKLLTQRTFKIIPYVLRQKKIPQGSFGCLSFLAMDHFLASGTMKCFSKQLSCDNWNTILFHGKAKLSSFAWFLTLVVDGLARDGTNEA